MKIRALTPAYYPKAASLLDHAFAPSKYEVKLFDRLHEHDRTLHEWVCIVRNSVVAYLGFTNAYNGKMIVGLHLGPLAVQPQMQGQGIGSELLRFALRQEGIRESTIFVLGNAGLFQKFGFEHCDLPICPFDKNNKSFLNLKNGHESRGPYTIGYEPEFKELKIEKSSKRNDSRRHRHP